MHGDNLNTPRLATNQQGVKVWSWEGEACGGTMPTGSVTINLRFPGQYYDAESGLHYNHHRYYDPKLGRYVTSDPIGLRGGLNTYTYVLNNPHRYVDPTGRSPLCFVWPIGTITCGAAAILISSGIVKCSVALDDAKQGMKNANHSASEKQKAIDCITKPSCSGSTAQQHEDNARESANQAIRDAGRAAYGLGTSIPGTSASGPVPTTITDVVVGGAVGEVIY